MVVLTVMLTMDMHIMVTSILLPVAALVPPKVRNPVAELVVERKPGSPAKVAVEAAARMEKANLAKLHARPVENVMDLVSLARKPRSLVAELVVETRPIRPVLPSLLVEALAPQKLKSLAVELAVATKPRSLAPPSVKAAARSPASAMVLVVLARVPPKRSLAVEPVVEAAVARKPRSTKNPRRPRKVT